MGFRRDQVEAAAARLLARSERRVARREDRRRQLQQDVDELAGRLQKLYGVSRIFVIGSLDMPWFTDGSDVDVVVEGLSPERASDAEREAVSLLQAPVDLLRFEELDPTFRDRVIQEGRQLR